MPLMVTKARPEECDEHRREDEPSRRVSGSRQMLVRVGSVTNAGARSELRSQRHEVDLRYPSDASL